MTQVPLERKVLGENDRIAAALREEFQRHGIFCLNLISSPGAGKTLLLERTLEGFAPDRRVAVLTGDIQTDNDARRLARYGFPVQQITTAGACHLDARMIERHLANWDLSSIGLLLIENVGNLVCPTSYDLGENAKVVILSVAEGDDKPLKYPAMFRTSEALIVNKIDLAPHIDVSLEKIRRDALSLNPRLAVMEVSCRTGEGLETWYRWLEERRQRKPD
jgi:hydrogenase nickel incorporation protein HypB